MNNNNLNIAFVGVGSNKGNRLENIKNALKFINDSDHSRIESTSSIYETLPLGEIEQTNFLNAVFKITTRLNSFELFDILKEIEKKLGRIKRENWGPREIDLDILFYNDLIISNEIITLPHKGIIYRDFVMIPLIEIEPEIVHPVFDKKLSEIILGIKSKNILDIRAEQLFTEEKNIGI